MTGPGLDRILEAALREDLGETGDLTSTAIVPESSRARARIVARQHGCVAGVEPALRVFHLLDDGLEIRALVEDGCTAEPEEPLASVTGPTRAILAGERLALNLLCHLSGVATATRAFVERIAHTGAQILDTRKTTPLLRELEKAAVVAGGGTNHRMGLHDAVLIKDNHVAAAGSAAQAVALARAHVGEGVEIEVEIDRVEDLERVIAAGADVVMLDNMAPERLREAVELAAGRCLLEASGSITLETVASVAETGVDRISVGWITHSAPALDIGLDVDE